MILLLCSEYRISTFFGRGDKMNKIKAMRVITGKNQKAMSELLNMSISSYRKKEKGSIAFSDKEKEQFIKIVKNYYPVATIGNIFFDE